MELRAIGRLSTPWSRIADCPRNGRQPDPAPLCHATVFDEFREGLQGIAGFSHLLLLYWLGTEAAARLVFTPPFDDVARGVFATRAPWRPNPIGVSVVRFEGVDAEGRLAVRYLDCLDGTALLDIKPYLPTTDAVPEASMGWLARHRTAPQAG